MIPHIKLLKDQQNRGLDSRERLSILIKNYLNHKVASLEATFGPVYVAGPLASRGANKRVFAISTYFIDLNIGTIAEHI